MKDRYNKNGDPINNTLYFVGYTIFIIGLLLFCVWIGLFVYFNNKPIIVLLGIFALLVILIGLIIYFASGANANWHEHTVVDKNNNIISNPNITHTFVTDLDVPPDNTAPTHTNLDELPKLKKLLDDGIVTQEEFDAKKKQLLDL